MDKQTCRIPSAFGRLVVFVGLAVCGEIAVAQNIGMLINGRDRVAIFDTDAGVILNDVQLASSTSFTLGDCEITPDGRLGLVSDQGLRGIWVFDLTADPPALSADGEFIPLPGAIVIDLAISADGQYVVTGSNSNRFLPITSSNIATRSEVNRIGLTSTQSVAACDNGDFVGTRSFGRAQRFELDGDGRISLESQSTIPPFYLQAACAPGSQTAVLGSVNTSFFGNGQFRSVSLPDMTTIQVVHTGSTTADLVLNKAGDQLYARVGRRLRGYDYDPVSGAIGIDPFFDVDLPNVSGVGAAENVAIHPDGSRLYVPTSGRIDVFSTVDGAVLGSVEDPAIVGGGPICASPALAPVVVLVADAGGPYSVDEGTSISLSAALSTGPIANVEWDFDFDGMTFSVDATGLTPTFDAGDLDGPDTRTVAVRIDDGNGNEDTATATVEILNVAPVADAGGPYVVGEGGTITLQGSASDVPADQDSLLFEWDLDGDGIFDDAVGPNPVLDATLLDGPDLLTVSLRVSDGDGGVSSGSDVQSADVEVENVAPSVGEIVGLPIDPEAITEMLTVSAAFFDPGSGEEYAATWDWGDGTTSAGDVTANADGTGVIAGEHQYAIPGVYVVSVAIDDGDGGFSGTEFNDFIVVYDPDAGFVTGGGWIESPPGAYLEDSTLSGSANFGFVAKYKKGAQVPDGSTEFQFQAGGLNFHSNSYDWLVVAGARAQFKGVGTVNGTPGYGFMLTAIDGRLSGGGGTDRFRIKIWEIASGSPVYDNQAGAENGSDPTTVLTAGSIVIHKQGNK